MLHLGVSPGNRRTYVRAQDRLRYLMYSTKMDDLHQHDFEHLPFIEWVVHHPMSVEHQAILLRHHSTLVRELNTLKPSRLFSFLIGRKVLNFQDEAVILHRKSSEFAVNAAFLHILKLKGDRAFKAFCDGLRSRCGAHQGYLAELLEGTIGENMSDLIDIFKIVSYHVALARPLGWAALPRDLGVPVRVIESCKRENRLGSHRLVHCLIRWMDCRTDAERLLDELVNSLYRLNLGYVATGVEALRVTMPQEGESETSELTAADIPVVKTTVHTKVPGSEVADSVMTEEDVSLDKSELVDGRSNGRRSVVRSENSSGQSRTASADTGVHVGSSRSTSAQTGGYFGPTRSRTLHPVKGGASGFRKGFEKRQVQTPDSGVAMSVEAN
ncbi:uncharacterized protein LOC144867448 [Branchiostoma floridae x Branchiostoma japonicum]